MTTLLHITRHAEAHRRGRRAGWSHRMLINDFD